ncbi:hypothetical protein [Bradyrhizobium sp. SZCCHNR1020]|uniref:hypothetical protein n=1 Tax=Bradyrhizobium sp. SZCCHNR1020 TaxID=3057343 RepID=UPI002916B8F7|nr:hypothetical protein [Bradyrhizobium sp. SZCCHNR1020]
MTAERKYRRRSIASDEASAWARSLQLNNPNGKSVLRGLAIYANSEGVCFVGIDQLAEDTDLSADTVRRRLVWLEQIGAIARLAQWLDANGRRNGEGRGKRTSDEIRLLLNADIDAIEAAACGGVSHADMEEPAAREQEFSPSSVQGLNSEPKTVSPRLALGQPSQSCEGLISEPEPEDSPHPPSGGASVPEDWHEFERDWEEPILRQSLAQPIWAGLTADERKLARQAARGYVSWRKSQKRPPNVIAAHRFLRERDAWPGYATRAPDAAASRSVHPPGSIEVKAIEGLHQLAGRGEAFRTILCGRDGSVRWRHAITPQVLAFAQLPEAAAWVELDRNGAGAWEALMRQFFEDGVVRKHFREGARAPWRFPPSSEGKVYVAAGPPAAALSEQDVVDFR